MAGIDSTGPQPLDGEGGSPREQVARALSGFLTADQLEKLIDEALAIRKSAWGRCKECAKSVQIEVLDAKAVIGATTDLLTSAFGPPQVKQADRALTINRTIEYVCEDGHPCPTCEAAGKRSHAGLEMLGGEVVSREGFDDAA